MTKIYGFKQSDILELADFIKANQNKSKTRVFSEFAQIKNKAKGTVRNMYYALAKQSKVDPKLANDLFNGTPISVNKIKSFTEGQERELVKNVLIEKAKGNSVRSTITKMANGDISLALRLQNKYRNSIKNNKDLVEKVIKEINASGLVATPFKSQIESKSYLKEEQLSRLKKEIDGLIEKISFKLKKENAYLKERISFLELENLRLNNILYSGQSVSAKENKLINYFTPKTPKDLPN